MRRAFPVLPPNLEVGDALDPGLATQPCPRWYSQIDQSRRCGGTGGYRKLDSGAELARRDGKRSTSYLR